jgi:MFS family permease
MNWRPWDHINKGIFTRLDWWLTGFCLSRTFTSLVFMTYAAALPILQKDWGMSGAAGGSISSGFQIGYAISLVVFSNLADLFGPKPLYLASVLAGSVSSVAFAFLARDYFSALLLYTLVGLSLGGTYTTGLMILANQYAFHRRGMAIGFFIASASLGHALSLVLSGIALPMGGYKMSFLLTCLGPPVGFFFAWLTLRGTPVQMTQRQKQQKFAREVLGNRPAMLLIGSYTFHVWELLGMRVWTPAFLASCLVFSGVGRLEATGLGAYVSAFFHIMGLAASSSMGMLSDRLGRARVIVILSGTSALCSFLFGWSIGWPLVFVVGLGMIYAFSTLGDSPILSTALTEVVETSYVGAAFGLRSLLGFSAGAIAPVVFGAVLDWRSSVASGAPYHSWGWAYSSLGMGGLCAFIMAYLLNRVERGRT